MTAPTIAAKLAGKSYKLRLQPSRCDPMGRPIIGVGHDPLDDIAAIAGRLSTKTQWLQSDVRRVIRMGLIGGGYGVQEADRIEAEHIDKTPLIECLPIALQLAALYLSGPDGGGA